MFVLRRHTHVLASLTAASFLLAACGAKEEAPELPPLESMSVNLEGFTTPATALTSSANFGAAAFRVGLVNLGVALALAVPAAVFAVALTDKHPTLKGGKWIWDFDAQTLLGRLGSELTAWMDGTTLNLEMRVTGGQLTNFLYYTGTFDKTTGSGSWQFYNHLITQADKQSVKITFAVTDETHRTVTFLVTRTDGNVTAGDSLAYSRLGDAATVTLHDASENANATAGISVSTGAGYLEAPGYNGGMRACWDAQHADTSCP